MSENKFHTIKDKIIITADMTLITGMHIGASNDFSPIGAVDSVVVKDSLTGKPIVPGSSIKGKLRTIIAKLKSDSNEYFLSNHNNDKKEIKELFGSSADNDIKEAKLQFYDLFLKNADELEKKNLDLGYTEIKFENTINRATAVANPRQLERVPAGAIFEFKLIYNAIKNEKDNIVEDFILISSGIKALQLDYLGGSGTRGYGKVSFSNFKVEKASLTENDINIDNIIKLLKESENFVETLITKNK
ncbi:type III-A CRISPR-associated RAMP protein Csm3 [uncultured Brachyspira sp.]|uniref:type III-A CRISPR-associated RAMP protein Csm3 n=1 Tax=uncultured Brachyspira sp. TaxID=221953 RepID=UPI0025829E89|nr:type III-A CRISPR-associated RAMP protein Csm3 [uncultured Brachyspira sp.]